MDDPGHRVLWTPGGLGAERGSDLLAMPGELAGQSVPGSQSESLRRHPARTSGSFGNSGTSEEGDKPHARPERPILLAVDQEFGLDRRLAVASRAPTHSVSLSSPRRKAARAEKAIRERATQP